MARFRQIYTVFCILLICALVSFDGYVMLYPLNSLAEEINFTKDLIKLMPAIKDNTAARRLYWADQTPDSP